MSNQRNNSSIDMKQCVKLVKLKRGRLPIPRREMETEDKICGGCGQIFSCDSALFEHIMRKCAAFGAVPIETFNGLKCPQADCEAQLATFEELQQHHTKEHADAAPDEGSTSKLGIGLNEGDENGDDDNSDDILVVYDSTQGATQKGSEEREVPSGPIQKEENGHEYMEQEGAGTPRRGGVKPIIFKNSEFRLLASVPTNESSRKQGQQKLPSKVTNEKPNSATRPKVSGVRPPILFKRGDQRRHIERVTQSRTDHSAYSLRVGAEPNSLKSYRSAIRRDVMAQSKIQPHPRMPTLVVRSKWNTGDLEPVEMLSDDGGGLDCCKSEIPVIRQRARHMEIQCDKLFFMLRNLLQSTHLEEMSGWQMLEKPEPRRVIPENTEITDYEERQMDALRAAKRSEWLKAAARRVCRKEGGADTHDGHLDEASIPGTSHSVEDSTMVLEPVIQLDSEKEHQSKAPRLTKSASEKTMKNKTKGTLKAPKVTIEKEMSPSVELLDAIMDEIDDEETLNSENYKRKRGDESVIKGREAKIKRRYASEEPAVLINPPLVAGEPRVDEESATILHPVERRPLEKDELTMYIARAILRMKTDLINKSRIRMLAPSWMHITDDSDIINAITDLQSNGLITLKHGEKARKQSFDVYKKVEMKGRENILHTLLRRYGLTVRDFDGDA